MNEMELTYEDLLQIVQLIDASSKCVRLHVKLGDIELEIERGTSDGRDARIHREAPADPIGDKEDGSRPEQVPTVAESERKKKSEPVALSTDIPPGAHVVKAPMIGTFYRSPEPGKPPFVEIGQRVEADDTVGLIEVMKLFNSISAGKAGVITGIFVKDAQPVEYGQPLIVIDPDE